VGTAAEEALEDLRDKTGEMVGKEDVKRELLQVHQGLGV